jgi:hypothetical protein
MTNPWPLSELEIIGYSDVLTETTLPSVVPPVFRIKVEPDRVLLPPYSFNGGFVCDAAEVDESEFRALADDDEVTVFEEAVPATPGYELWVDRSFVWHYEPREQADGTLTQIAIESMNEAERALNRGDLERAEHLSGSAISADDRRVEPLAIKAAIRRLRGDRAGEKVMEELAGRAVGPSLFDELVKHYCARHAAPVPGHGDRRPMHQVARAAA